MATFPKDAQVIFSAMELWQPGDVTLEHPYTGKANTVRLAPGRFRGQLVIGPAQRKKAQEIERFLMVFQGAETAEIPIHREVPPSGALAGRTVESQDMFGGAPRTIFNTGFPNSLETGMYLRIGDRLQLVTARSPNARVLEVSPVVMHAAGATVKQGTTVLAVRDGSDEYERTPNWSGPWTLNWREA